MTHQNSRHHLFRYHQQDGRHQHLRLKYRGRSAAIERVVASIAKQQVGGIVTGYCIVSTSPGSIFDDDTCFAIDIGERICEITSDRKAADNAICLRQKTAATCFIGQCCRAQIYCRVSAAPIDDLVCATGIPDGRKKVPAALASGRI